jgi:hypothetical protein
MKPTTILVIICAIVASGGCAPISTESKLSLLEKQWQRERAAIEGEGKTKYEKDNELLQKLFRESFSCDQRKTLPDTFHRWPANKFQRSEFQDRLICVAIWQAVDERQRETVVRILAETPPDMLWTLEQTLVLGAAKAFDDPILMMFDAYDSSTRIEAKWFLVTRLRYAFYGIVDEPDPNSFVEHCRDWYLDHRVEYKVDTSLRDGKKPLFVKRATKETSNTREAP